MGKRPKKRPPLGPKKIAAQKNWIFRFWRIILRLVSSTLWRVHLGRIAGEEAYRFIAANRIEDVPEIARAAYKKESRSDNMPRIEGITRLGGIHLNGAKA